jgi:hypothetical protein
MMLDYPMVLSMLLSITGEGFGAFFDAYVFGLACLCRNGGRWWLRRAISWDN